MKKKVLVIILSTALVASTFYVIDINKKSQLNQSKISELRENADKTNELIRIGKNLERDETSKGYYKIKGTNRFQWSIRDSYNLSDIGQDRIEEIHKAMVTQGWERQNAFEPTLIEDYASAKKWRNSFDLSYSKKTASTPICQRFSFWWKPQPIDNGKTANTFVYTQFADYCVN